MLTTTPASPRELREAGHDVSSIQRALHFRWCATESDYDAVLRLRHQAYGAVGKVDPSLSHTVMAESFDAGARCLMAEHQGRLVGTARLVLPVAGEPTEYDAYVVLPSWIERADLAVLSRIATHVDYRGGDLLYALVLRCLAAARAEGRRIVIGGCTEPLFHVYERVGARRSGRRFAHAALGGVEEQLIYFESDCVASGVGVRLDLWREICGV